MTCKGEGGSVSVGLHWPSLFLENSSFCPVALCTQQGFSPQTLVCSFIAAFTQNTSYFIHDPGSSWCLPIRVKKKRQYNRGTTEVLKPEARILCMQSGMLAVFVCFIRLWSKDSHFPRGYFSCSSSGDQRAVTPG